MKRFFLLQITSLVVVAILSGGGVYLVAVRRPDILGIKTETKPDPKTDQLISEVQKLVVNLKSPTPTQTAAPLDITSEKINFALFNGTSIVGVTHYIEADLVSLYKGAQITARAVAQSTNYSQTIIVDLSGTRGEDAKRIAKDLGISVGILPDGERAPDAADFLIIVGSDKIPS